MLRSKLLWWWGAGLLALVSLGLVGVGLLNRPYTFRGSTIDPAMPAPPIHLVDQNGKPFQLSDAKGKVVMLFFGYTHCPDECPATLAQFRQIRSDLGKQADQVAMVFVTIDPKRDTQTQIRSYLAQFRANIIGLTGSPADLTVAWKGYGVYVDIPEWGLTAPAYAVAHSTRVYIIDRQGNLRLTYTYGTPTEDMLQDVQYLLRGS
jgi:protein SCO1/2